MEDTFMNTKIIKIRALLDVVHGLLIDIDDEIKDMRWYTTNKNVKANPWKIIACDCPECSDAGYRMD